MYIVVCEVSVYSICEHLYFSCENVYIYQEVNTRSIESVLWNQRVAWPESQVWEREGGGEGEGGDSECNL